MKWPVITRVNSFLLQESTVSPWSSSFRSQDVHMELGHRKCLSLLLQRCYTVVIRELTAVLSTLSSLSFFSFIVNLPLFMGYLLSSFQRPVLCFTVNPQCLLHRHEGNSRAGHRMELERQKTITFHIQHMHSTTKPDVAITFQCRPDVCFINNSFLLPQVGSTVYEGNNRGKETIVKKEREDTMGRRVQP